MSDGLADKGMFEWSAWCQKKNGEEEGIESVCQRTLAVRAPLPWQFLSDDMRQGLRWPVKGAGVGTAPKAGVAVAFTQQARSREGPACYEHDHMAA